MKLRAIRLRDVGCFAGPVAVEGFADGLNVLAGPNELGKSTLLRALQVLLFQKPDADNKEVSRLRRANGGPPSIEADFEADGGEWRMSKTFRKGGKIAELRELGGTRRVIIGLEAHDAALELLRSAIGDTAWLGPLWVSQKAALETYKMDTATRGSLADLIEREIETATGGEKSRAIRASVEAWLAGVVTSTGRPKKNGRWHLAIQALDEAETVADMASRAAAEAEDRLTRLGETGEELAELSHPEAKAARVSAVEKAKAAVAEADKHIDRVKAVETKAENARLLREQAEAAAAKLSTLLQQHLALLEAQTRDAASIAELRDVQTERLEEIGNLEAACEQLQEAGEVAASELAALDLFTRKSELEARRDALREQIARWTTAQEALDQLRKARGEIRLDAPGLAALEVAARRIETLAARLAARAPRIAFDLTEAGVDRVRLDGQPLAQNGSRDILIPATIAIEGIGSFTVTPAAGTAEAGAEADETARFGEYKASLEDALAAAGFSSIDDARAGLTKAQVLEREMSGLAGECKALAPAGIDPLVAALDEADARLAEFTDAEEVSAPTEPREVVSARLDDLRKRYKAALEAVTVARKAHDAAAHKLMALEHATEQRVTQFAEIDAALPPVDVRDAEMQSLEERARATAKEHAEQLTVLAHLREHAPDTEARAALDVAVKSAEHARDAAETETNKLRVEIGRIEAGLERDRHDGVLARAEQAQADGEAARDALARIQAEVKAHEILRDALGHAADASRARFQAPVFARLHPFVRDVLGDATLTLGEDLSAANLMRGGASEDVTRLSDGTQEQISILVRLGLARLLADHGQPVPLILDDALVFSDDDRIARAFTVLETAAAHHQVIVLTCRTKAFDALGGHRLAITTQAEERLREAVS